LGRRTRIAKASAATFFIPLSFLYGDAPAMTTNKVDVATSPATAPPQRTSPARLVVLLGVLGLAIGAYAYDYLVARPQSKATYDKIQDIVDARNKMGVKEATLVTPDELHKELGMQPTFVEKHNDQQYEVEYYCWWGIVPFFNTRRHFISVVFYGDEPRRRFSSHHHNEKPPAEALPIVDEPPASDAGTLPQPQSAAAGGATGAEKGPAESKEATAETPASKDKD
jgi:hypothetical protein